MPDFILYALAAGLAIALVAGPLGAFAVWRRMAYFGDTLAHSALLGVTFGVLLQINLTLAVCVGCVLVALVLLMLQRQRQLATDTLLGILSHSTLALGLISVSLFSDSRVDLLAYLFGDILAVSAGELIAIWLVSVAVLLVLARVWRPLLSMTVHEDLARIEGVAVDKLRALLMIMMALVIAMAMKVVGVLLITALLIIPAATARRLTATPEAMAIAASGLGCIAVVLGLAGAYRFDTPAGPSIVAAASGLFVLSLLRRQA